MEDATLGDMQESVRESALTRGERLQKIVRKWGPLLTLIVVVVVIYILNPRFLSVNNLKNLARQSSIPLVLSMGMTYVILMGSIDLSIEGLMAMTCVVLSLLVANDRTELQLGLLGVLIAVGVSALMGFVNGVIYVKGRIPSFMVTLGMLSIGAGVSVVLYKGVPVRILDPMVHSWAKGFIAGIPTIAVLSWVVFLLALLIERYTRLGRYIYAIGGGEDLAEMSGIPVDKVKIVVFTLSGCFIGIGGVLNAARIGVGTQQVGAYLFAVITSVVVGGTALTGGIGGVLQTLIGVLIVTVISNGMILLDVHSYIQMTVHGIIVTVAVILTFDRSKIPIVK